MWEEGGSEEGVALNPFLIAVDEVAQRLFPHCLIRPCI